jgi:crotonobetainyl-CoA:carnitine CoA-transferase CaiB-like acyl-CoA transferase
MIFSDANPEIEAPAPFLNEHVNVVLGKILGSERRIAELRINGIV